MARRLLLGAGSVGLSALLAALMLTATPPPGRDRRQEPPETMPAKPQPAKVEASSAVLPVPPRKPPPVPVRVLEPTVPRAEKVLTVRPLRPTAPKPIKVANGEATANPTVMEQPAKPIAGAKNQSSAVRGRVLLRLLEHGRGPAIELAWPGAASERARLYRHFRDCLGMRLALSPDRGPAAGRLFVANDPPGQAWRPNSDRYSGFARRPAGRLAVAERDDLRAIARRHDLSPYTPAMRIFPRRVDARLLGGLDRVLAGAYGRAGAIRASYRLQAGTIQVRDIQVDGRAVPGSISLNSPCRGS
ncbi:MAG: hypothetical protein QF512_17520 [Alphaproteobacteria bacterium]|nr:hypothetical protein [Alphaproteobacteria bacterium]